MFLYENNGQFIDVYKLEPKLEEITKYKKSEMGKIPDGNRVLIAETNDWKEKVLEKRKDIFYASDLDFEENGYCCWSFHRLIDNKDKEKCNETLNDYYEEIDSVYSFSKIEGYDKEMYILMLNCNYFNINNKYVMDQIINVSESLYLLEALLQGRFNLLGDKDITEQLMLFDIQHIGRINTSVLKNICEYQLLTDSYESIINRSSLNKDVVNKVKKLAR